MRVLNTAIGIVCAATLCACSNSDDTELTPDLIDTLISLATSDGRTSLPADGFSTVELVVQLSEAPEPQTITFTTSAGAFMVGEMSAPSAEVLTSSEGIARIALRSNEETGAATIQARVKDSPQLARELVIEFTQPNIDEIIRIEPLASPAPADGATRTTIVAVIGEDVPLASRTVEFTTTRGTFAGSTNATATVTATADNRARADLISPSEAGDARVTAKLRSFTQVAEFTFVPAPPDRILLSSSALSVPADATASVALTATLERNVGSVTDGRTGTFTARLGDGTELMGIRDVSTSSGGKITAKFAPGPIAARGNVTIMAMVEGSDAVGETTVAIVDPPEMETAQASTADVERLETDILALLAAASDKDAFAGVFAVLLDDAVIIQRDVGLAGTADVQAAERRFPVDAFAAEFDTGVRDSSRAPMELRSADPAQYRRLTLFEPLRMEGTRASVGAAGASPPLYSATLADLVRWERALRKGAVDFPAGFPVSGVVEAAHRSVTFRSGTREAAGSMLLRLEQPATSLIVLTNGNTLLDDALAERMSAALVAALGGTPAPGTDTSAGSGR